MLLTVTARGGGSTAGTTTKDGFAQAPQKNQSVMLARFLRETAADVVMLAGRYTLLDRSALDDVLPAAQESGRSVSRPVSGNSLPAAIAFPTTHPSCVNVTLGMRDRAEVTRNMELQ